MIFSALINNITLIISLSILYSFIIRRWKYGSHTGQVISGLLFGVVAIVGMMNPLIFSPGLIFDGRSIIISIAGFIGGWVTALVAALMAIIYRTWLGGTGQIMGVSVIASSAVIGIAYYYIRRNRPDLITPLYLIGFGIIVHICMLAMTMTLPSSMKYEVLSNIAVPVIVIYPLGTLLVCVVLLDLESRLRAEDALRESENRQRTYIENAPDGVVIIDDTGRFIEINYSGCRMTGYSKEEITKISFRDLLADESLDNGLEHFKEVMETGAAKTDLWHKNKNGYKCCLSVASVKLSQTRILGFMKDITDRKQAEEELLKSEERYRSLVENANEAIMVIQDGLIKFVNSRAVAAFGYSKLEFMSIPIFELIHPEDRDVVTARYLQKINGDTTSTWHTYRTIHKSGQINWIEISSVLIDWEGRPATLNLISDITARRTGEEEKRILEERLQRAEKMEALGQLAGGVAHDLNNVLGILSGYSELLLMEIPAGQRARGHAEKILQSTEKGAAIIQDLLTLARRGVTVSDVINLNDVIATFLKTPVFENTKNYHPRVTFQAECDKNLLNIKGSPVHLEKTLMNLVSNAAESISGKGEVTIRTESRYLDKAISGYDTVKEGDYAILTVSDTGMGIPAEHREKIFEPFYTKKTMGRSGTGLGLAIVWGTVKDHNGYIDVQTKVDEGSTFTLYFPVTREELITPQQKEPIERYRGKGESVLVVDDIAEQRDVASGLLTTLGYEVHVVSGGEEAVEYLRENKADILVLDMIMTPGIDGLETYRRILEVNPQQKAILVSGFSETDRVKKAQKLGAGAYVKKPYVMEKIGVAIRDELTR